MKPVQFLAVGDLVTDAFIRLKDAHVTCSLNHERCELCMRYGDKIPFEFAEEIKAVGNSANAAVAAARLGLSSGLISHVGDDMQGKDAVAELLKRGVSPKYVVAEKGKKTNYHYVLWFESERTILIKHEAFSYIWQDPVEAPQWLYLSSLGHDTEAYHDAIIGYLKKHPEVLLAFQPGTFQLKLGIARLMEIYARSNVFVCNVQEAEQLLDVGAGTLTPDALAVRMQSYGPKIVVITDGPKGAYVAEGKSVFFQPPYPDPHPPYERTGAGDAFASTFTSCIALGMSVSDALMRAPINSMSVVQKIGAQAGLLSLAEIEEWLTKAPADYKTKQLK